jgi:hypothetical protein
MCLPFPIVRSKQVKCLLTNRDFKVWSCTLMKNKGLQTVQRSFFRKKAKICRISTKNKVKLAIITALVLLCHKCIVEFEKNLLLS